MRPAVNLYRLGRLPYVRAYTIQQVLFNKLKDEILLNNIQAAPNNKHLEYPTATTKINSATTLQENNNFYRLTNDAKQVRNSLLLVEHEPVYTIGIRAMQYNDNYVARLKDRLSEHNLEANFVKTNRGGLITFHGIGQLVAYPIIYLGDFKSTISNRSVRSYVDVLERTIIDTLSKVGLSGAHTVKEHPGVWLDNGQRKIAFIGISCKRYVTMHGISINCDCNLSWFDHIVSCGIEDKTITSVYEELKLSKQLQQQQKQDQQEFPLIETVYQSLEEGHRSRDHQSTMSSNSSEWGRQLKAETIQHGPMELESRSSVDGISKAFCSSFSQYFNCILEEKDPNYLLSTTLGKL